MMSKLRKANDAMIKELDWYHKREAQMQQKEAALEETTAENEALQERIKELQQWENEKIKYQKELDKKKQEILEYNQEEERIFQEREQELEEVRLALKRAQDVKNEIASKEEQEKKLRDEMEKMRLREQELLDKVKRGEELSQQEQDELNKLRAIIKEREDEIEELLRQLALMKQKQQEVENEKQKNNDAQKKVLQLQTLLATKQKKLQQDESMLNDKRKNLLGKSTLSKQKQLDDLLKQIDNLNNENKDILKQRELEKQQLEELTKPTEHKNIFVKQYMNFDQLVKVKSQNRIMRIWGCLITGIAFLCLFFNLVSTGNADWLSGPLYRTNNRFPVLQEKNPMSVTIDQAIYSHLDYTGGSDLPVGKYKRGLFSQCEEFTNYDNNQYEHKLQVQILKRPCTEIYLPLAVQAWEMRYKQLDGRQDSTTQSQQNFYWKKFANSFNRVQRDERKAVLTVDFFRNRPPVYDCDMPFTDQNNMNMPFTEQQEFNLEHFQGCRAVAETDALRFVQFSAITIIIVQFCIAMMTLINFYDPNQFQNYFKPILGMIIYVGIFGFLSSVVFGVIGTKMYPFDNKQSFYIHSRMDFRPLDDYTDLGAVMEKTVSDSLGSSYGLFTFSWILNLVLIAVLLLMKKLHKKL